MMKKERGEAGQPTRKAMTSVKVVTETATPEESVVTHGRYKKLQKCFANYSDTIE